MLGWEIPCETTTIQKMTVKPLIHTTSETFLFFLLFNIFASDASGIHTYATVVSSWSDINALLTELSEGLNDFYHMTLHLGVK